MKKRGTRGAVALWVATAVTLTASIAAAEPFGYVTGEVPGGGRGLLELDLATGALTPVGPPFGIPGAYVRALAFAPDGTLWGVDDIGRRLLRIDPSTGGAQVVAGLDLTDPVVSLNGLTFDACGRLFATGGLSGGTEFRDVLLELDPLSGGVTELTPAGSEPVFHVAARGEDLYVWTLLGLARIEPESHAAIPVGPVPNELGGSLDFDANGVLWGYGLWPPDNLPNPLPPVDLIYQIDPTTGATGEPIAMLPALHSGLAIAPPPGVCISGAPLAVPALSPGGIAILVLLLIGLGMFLLRRDAEDAKPG